MAVKSGRTRPPDQGSVCDRKDSTVRAKWKRRGAIWLSLRAGRTDLEVLACSPRLPLVNTSVRIGANFNFSCPRLPALPEESPDVPTAHGDVAGGPHRCG